LTRLSELRDPLDPRLTQLSALLNATFPDPNSVLGPDRIKEFLAEKGGSRRFTVVVSEEDQAVVGGTIFSYVPGSNCGFSEYIVADRRRRGLGLGRQLFDARKAILDELAARHGLGKCHGLFIEADNPKRTPSEFADAERATALEAYERLRLFAHLGFHRVDIPYVQPPLAVDKEPVDYLDLLFAPWTGEAHHIPADWIFDTVEPIWSAWSPATFATHLARLKARVLASDVHLLDLPHDAE
jgi:GNAT superfamily N-acetyltransferase